MQKVGDSEHFAFLYSACCSLKGLTSYQEMGIHLAPENLEDELHRLTFKGKDCGGPISRGDIGCTLTTGPCVISHFTHA